MVESGIGFVPGVMTLGSFPSYLHPTPVCQTIQLRKMGMINAIQRLQPNWATTK